MPSRPSLAQAANRLARAVGQVRNKNHEGVEALGQKQHFIIVLCPPELEINILMSIMSSAKCITNHSVNSQLYFFKCSADNCDFSFSVPELLSP